MTDEQKQQAGAPPDEPEAETDRAEMNELPEQKTVDASEAPKEEVPAAGDDLPEPPAEEATKEIRNQPEAKQAIEETKSGTVEEQTKTEVIENQAEQISTEGRSFFQAPAVEPETASEQQSVPREIIREVVVEKEKPLTEVDRETIFRNKLQANLVKANQQKQASFEAHLQAVVDFIRRQGRLVTNQDIEKGLKIPDSTVTKRLNDLINRGLVVRLGDQFHAKYKLKERL